MSCCSARQMDRRRTIPVIARLLYGLITVVVVSAAACSRDPHAAMLKFEKSGDAFANAGNLHEAIIDIRNAIQQEPRAGDVRVKLAETYIRQGDLAKAVDDMYAPRTRCPTPRLKSGRATCCWSRGVLTMRRRGRRKPLRQTGRTLKRNPARECARRLEESGRRRCGTRTGDESNPGRGATYTTLGQWSLNAAIARHRKSVQARGRTRAGYRGSAPCAREFLLGNGAMAGCRARAGRSTEGRAEQSPRAPRGRDVLHRHESSRSRRGSSASRAGDHKEPRSGRSRWPTITSPGIR